MSTPVCRVVSFNIRVGIETSLAHVACDLESLKPDFVALQEVGESWIMGPPLKQTAYLASALGLPYFHFAPSLTAQSGQHFGISVLSRWPLLEMKQTLLPREKDEQRSSLALQIHPPFSPHPWSIFTTHLSIEESERIQQSQVIAHQVRTALHTTKGPVLVLGDLNDRPFTSTLTQLTSQLTDSYAHFNGQNPSLGYTFSVKDPHRRIDYLLTHQLDSHHVEVCTHLKSSDHFPLLGVFSERIER